MPGGLIPVGRRRQDGNRRAGTQDRPSFDRQNLLCNLFKVGLDDSRIGQALEDRYASVFPVATHFEFNDHQRSVVTDAQQIDFADPYVSADRLQRKLVVQEREPASVCKAKRAFQEHGRSKPFLVPVALLGTGHDALPRAGQVSLCATRCLLTLLQEGRRQHHRIKGEGFAL